MESQIEASGKPREECEKTRADLLRYHSIVKVRSCTPPSGTAACIVATS